MLRTLFCALLGLAMVVGVADAKQKTKTHGKAVHGKFVSFQGNTLTVAVTHKKKGEEPTTAEKTFEVTTGTPVYVSKGDQKPEKLTSPDAFQGVKAGTHVRVFLSEDGKVVRVGVGAHKRHKKPQE